MADLREIGLACNASTTTISGTLEYEPPVNLCGNNQMSGECSVGAFTYLNSFSIFANARIGRYCSIAQWVIAGPGQHHIDFFSTHPFVYDPQGATSGLFDFEEYRRILGNSPIVSSHRPNYLVAPEISIGHDVWIGARAIIMEGVKIGHGGSRCRRDRNSRR